jgi:hypothetical protein
LDFDDKAWAKIPALKLGDKGIPAEVFSAEAKFAWDEENLYFRFDIKDSDPGVNKHEGREAWRGDCLEFFLAADPERSIPGFLKQNDYQLLLTPFAANGSKISAAFCDPSHDGKEPEGLRHAFKTKPEGWQAVVAIPFKSLGLPPQKAGARLAMEVAIDNLGAEHPRFQISSNKRGENSTNACIWSYLNLEN